MERRKFTRELKREAVKLIPERGVTVTQAARDSSSKRNGTSSKKPRPTSGRRRCEGCLHGEAPGDLLGGMVV